MRLHLIAVASLSLATIVPSVSQRQARADVWLPVAPKMSGFKFGDGATRDLDGRFSFVSAPATIQPDTAYIPEAFTIKSPTTGQKVPMSDLESGVNDVLRWGSTFTSNWVTTTSEAEEAEHLQRSLSLAVSSPFGGVSYSSAVSEARSRRSSSYTAYLLITSTYPDVKPSFRLSDEAAAEIKSLESSASDEVAWTEFRRKFGDHFVSTVSVGARIEVQISANKSAFSSQSEFSSTAKAGFGAFGFSVSGASSEARAALSKLQQSGLSIGVVVDCGDAFRRVQLESVGYVNVPERLPGLITEMTELDNLLRVLKSPDLYIRSKVQQVGMKPIGYLLPGGTKVARGYSKALERDPRMEVLGEMRANGPLTGMFRVTHPDGHDLGIAMFVHLRGDAQSSEDVCLYVANDGVPRAARIRGTNIWMTPRPNEHDNKDYTGEIVENYGRINLTGDHAGYVFTRIR